MKKKNKKNKNHTPQQPQKKFVKYESESKINKLISKMKKKKKNPRMKIYFCFACLVPNETVESRVKAPPKKEGVPIGVPAFPSSVHNDLNSYRLSQTAQIRNDRPTTSATEIAETTSNIL